MMPAPPTPQLPEPRDLSRDANGTPLGGDAKWTTYKGAHRPCDRCVRSISQGLMNTHPHPARRKRSGPGDAELLCLQHAERQETRDQMVKNRLAAQRASTKKRRA